MKAPGDVAANYLREQPDVRAIFMREGVGAAGGVIQRAQLPAHRVTVDLPALVIVEQGQKQLRWKDGHCTARAGDAVAMNCGQTVEIRNVPGPSGEYSARWISWSAEIVNAFAQEVGVLSPPSSVTYLPRLSPEFILSCRAAFESLLDAEGIPPSVADHRFREVLIWLQELGVFFSPPTTDTIGSRLRTKLLSNPGQEWTIEDIAKQVGTSAATLRRRLAAEDLTFRDLLHDIRMTYALNLLQNTDNPVLSIASAVGYDSASRFAARFRSRFGYLPSDVRGQKRGDSPTEI